MSQERSAPTRDLDEGTFPLRVLVHEEDERDLAAVTRRLLDAGHRVIPCRKAVAIRAEILATRPDLVLLDPAAGGVVIEDLAVLIGQHPSTADTRVVLHCRTAADGKRQAHRAFAVMLKTPDDAQFAASFARVAREYLEGALPKDDRAAIAERRFSGTQRIAAALGPSERTGSGSK